MAGGEKIRYQRVTDYVIGKNCRYWLSEYSVFTQYGGSLFFIVLFCTKLMINQKVFELFGGVLNHLSKVSAGGRLKDVVYITVVT